MPPNPNNKPINTLVGTFGLFANKPIITSHSGKIDAIIEPSPPEIYLTPSVVRPLVRNKFNALSTRIFNHSFPFGQVVPLKRK